jgi:hypothetical protein
MRWTFPAPLAKAIDSLIAALDDHLDAAVASISYPAGDARSLCLAATALAEEHSLDIAVYNETAPDHASAV